MIDRCRRRLSELLAIAAVLGFVATSLWAQAPGPQAPAAQAPAAQAPAAQEPEAQRPLDLPPDLRAFLGDPDPDLYPVQLTPVEPPDGVWLKDEEGRDYFLQPLPKEGAVYERLEDGRVRYNHAGILTVAKEDETSFYLKVFKPEAPKPMIPEITPEALAEAETRYESVLPSGDSLRFEPFGRGLPDQGQWRNGFAVADMNGDGHPDIVHGPPRKRASVPLIFLGDGAGGWRYWEEAKFPPAYYDYGDVAVADFNGDGHQDMVLAVHLRGLLALVGDGAGSFSLWTEGIDFEVPGAGSAGMGFTARAVATADWNRDGRVDIIALGEGPKPALGVGRRKPKLLSSESYGIAVFLNQGDGTWRKRVRPGTDRKIFGEALAVADFNQDGNLDAALASSVLNRRDLLLEGKQDGAWEPVDLPTVPRAVVQGVAAADFDGDGRVDIAMGYTNAELGVWRSGIDVVYNRGENGWERKPLKVRKSRDGISSLAAGDLNGDGLVDLVAITEIGETWIFLGQGARGFTWEEAAEIEPPVGGCRGYHVAVVDLDRDGQDEIVEEFAGEPHPLYARDVCPTGGVLRAWKPTRQRSTDAAEEPLPPPSQEGEARSRR